MVSRGIGKLELLRPHTLPSVYRLPLKCPVSPQHLDKGGQKREDPLTFHPHPSLRRGLPCNRKKPRLKEAESLAQRLTAGKVSEPSCNAFSDPQPFAVSLDPESHVAGLGPE